MKYSAGYWPDHIRSLDDAEAAMLALTCYRSELEDGMEVLDLGCGWGSLSFWIAEQYPNCRILAVTNSSAERDFIRNGASRRGLDSLEVLTADLNHFDTDRRFDRVFCIEMFEQMRNWRMVLAKISGWLKVDGKVFLQVFAHRRFAYLYQVKGAADWLGKTFFSGGLMPSDHLLLYFQEHLLVNRHWRLSGRHYRKTAEAWLQNLQARKRYLLAILEKFYGKRAASVWLQRWRMSLLGCAEMGGYRGGEEWLVSHYLLSQNPGGMTGMRV